MLPDEMVKIIRQWIERAEDAETAVEVARRVREAVRKHLPAATLDG